MPPSKQDIPKERIESEVYNAFGRFKEVKHVKITDFLRILDTESFGEHKYRKIRFPYEALLKLILFQKLKGIKFHTKLTKYLNKNPSEKYKLGFTKTPDRTTIGYFVNHILDDETKELIDFAVTIIEEITEKFGILIDVETLKPEQPKKETKERNQFYQKNDKTKEICKVFKKRLEPHINLHIGNNAHYKKNQFTDILIHNGMTRDFAENGTKTLGAELEKRRIYCPKCHIIMLPAFILLKNGTEINTLKCTDCGYEKRTCPDADTLFHHIKKYSSCEDVFKMYTTFNEIIWEAARKNNLFDIRKKFNVAIDFTEWLFYGDRSTPMVVGKKPERGTTKCYKFATINIVEAGKRFTLLALPVGPFDTTEEVLTRLLSYALERIKIRRILVDRGFCNSNAIKVFNSFHLKYLMPATKIPTVRDVLEVASTPSIVTDFAMKDITFNLVIVEEELKDGTREKRAFATNEEYNENDVNLADRLFDLYGKRWGIETSYRVKKHSFLPKTTSKNYRIRFFYFMLSVLLYNLWILADILIWLALFGVVGEKHLLTSKYFGTILYMIESGG